MSKSFFFRLAAIITIWVVMANAGFGIILTLLAVGATFLVVNIIVLVGQLFGRVTGR